MTIITWSSEFNILKTVYQISSKKLARNYASFSAWVTLYGRGRARRSYSIATDLKMQRNMLLKAQKIQIRSIQHILATCAVTPSVVLLSVVTASRKSFSMVPIFQELMKNIESGRRKIRPESCICSLNRRSLNNKCAISALADLRMKVGWKRRPKISKIKNLRN